MIVWIGVSFFAGSIVVGCCWGIFRIAYNMGVTDGRNYEKVLLERYEAGKRDASLPSKTYIPLSNDSASREKESWEDQAPEAE